MNISKSFLSLRTMSEPSMNFVSTLETFNVLKSGILTASSMKHLVANCLQNVVQSLLKTSVTGYYQGTLWVSNFNSVYLAQLH
jgi:hypothetical protein